MEFSFIGIARATLQLDNFKRQDLLPLEVRYIKCAAGGRLVRSLVFALGQGCGGGVGIFREQVAVVFFGFRRRLRF